MTKPTVQHPITRWRNSRKEPLTAAAVAAAAGCSVTSLSKVERGHRDRLGADACMALAEAFPGELDVKELLAWSWSKAKRRKAS